MVFRGRPSKACERCRERRLLCDQQRPNCSSCIRMGVACTGYRDTTTLRISDQTDFVRSKAMARINIAQTRQYIAPTKIRHLPQDLQILGRDMFFTYYVSDFSRTWDFLLQYLDSPGTPEHITLGIEAVSLAFLSNQVSSQTAKDLGRRKYCEALRKINIALQDPKTAMATSTFEGALLLDLFEKIVKSPSDINTSRHAHVEGALALVKLRGVETFKEGSEMRALMGLSLNVTVCSLSTGRAIDDVVRQIREHAAQFVDTDYPKWKLSGLMLEVTDLAAETRKGTMSSEERVRKSVEIDQKLAAVALNASPAWTYERKFISGHHNLQNIVPDGFPIYDVYPNRMITQMWNVLRLTRILLCEEIVESCVTSSDPDSDQQSDRAKLTIVDMIQEICASVPQMTNCEFAAKHKLPSGSTGSQHTHTMPHVLDVYILIFTLYVVAWCRNCPATAYEWTVKQLHNIADHFGIKEAAAILDILRKQELEDRVDPWVAFNVYESVMMWKRTPEQLQLPKWLASTSETAL
ncbi:hypothetical protein EJ02DRAFT_400453 [Clathrospora elynae]|uniref:Zn(2)-C6 fungal-type domain-containing protein n=1 Tax=Clathrospora elynae TaxID=706981 RepID=A0A6A5T2U3_9PLEO|nr:hypothetical protein EJ02DRAFT_400453 [Clathrospora elynae]